MALRSLRRNFLIIPNAGEQLIRTFQEKSDYFDRPCKSCYFGWL